ncbi:MAG: hypothetical protein LBC63_03090 [Holophagales bacterium]|jgi:hypothetical protein|nr:hypothetical protein [Holophagales bacterium]
MGDDSWATSLIDALEDGPSNPLFGYACDCLGRDRFGRPLPLNIEPEPKPAPPPENPVYKLIRESIAKHKNPGNTPTAKE